MMGRKRRINKNARLLLYILRAKQGEKLKNDDKCAVLTLLYRGVGAVKRQMPATLTDSQKLHEAKLTGV